MLGATQRAKMVHVTSLGEVGVKYSTSIFYSIWDIK